MRKAEIPDDERVFIVTNMCPPQMRFTIVAAGINAKTYKGLLNVIDLWYEQRKTTDRKVGGDPMEIDAMMYETGEDWPEDQDSDEGDEP